MEEYKFASPAEIRQFLIALLTVVIVLACYHTVSYIVDSLERKFDLKYNVVHCYIHQANENDADEEENTNKINTENGSKPVSRKH